ncbi:MAG: NAD-dependent epimerase/dehydratase family protein, partial [Candidatus Izemoplasmatales bacterium]
MKCIVTGATGHIGNVLVKQLFQKGYEVIAIVLPKDDCKMIEPYAEIVLGNILDVAFLETALKNVDFVFHLAGIVEIGSGKKQSIFKVNVEGTRNVVNACLKNHIKRLIYTSSVHAIPELPKTETMVEIDHFDPVLVKGNYGKSKAMATQIVMDQKDSDLEVVIVHPSGVLGPADYKLSNVSQMFIDFLCGRLTAYLKGGYNFVDVRDVARGIILAAEKGKRGECYILSGSEITVKELLDEISLISGRKRVKTKLAFWFILAMSYFAELYYKVVKQKPLFTHYSIVVLNSNYHFSNEKAKRELGFTTRDIKESIKDAMDFAVENYLTK